MRPKILKLLQAKNRLKSKLDELNPIPYGNGNPYDYCASCKVAMVRASFDGHDDDCQYLKRKKDLKAVEGQVKKELKDFLSKKEYEKKAFLNFLWFKGDISVDGLWELNQEIKKYKQNLKCSGN